MKSLWCWRCKMEMPMLDEQEFATVISVIEKPSRSGKRGHFERMLEEYERITGFKETNANAIWHHRISIFGPPCRRCGKVLRTPLASKCFECGCPRTDGDGPST